MKNQLSAQFLNDIVNRFDITKHRPVSGKIWRHFLSSGSNLWMDTGDISKATKLWSEEFSALTTNNTLLNAEVQKGTYDEVVELISRQLGVISDEEKVTEIGFYINVIHGLRLSRTFNCMVSVEVHTKLANDVNGTYQIGKRLHAFSPGHFIIKVPFTAAGLIAARRLHNEGIPVNMTLCFSTRQNVLASMIAKPSFSNVFVGRVGAYFSNNGIKRLDGIGEKVNFETQKCLRKVSERGYANTKLIAASIRGVKQLTALVGTDVMTIPTNVIEDVLQNKDLHLAKEQKIASMSNVSNDLIRQFNLFHLWQVNEQEKEVAIKLADKLPSNESNIVNLLNQYGCHDIFPELTALELKQLSNDGKIPVHNQWSGKIENSEVGIDTLLNLAGLYAFRKDQEALDERIKQLL
ncbi:transaldolase family protein [Carboxylicivirga marina]|uniref:transaldolase family protein n=1 Tax=Carboxylicivirga marina TaxID=2800988 RepID=UPI002597E1F4|nr:transaldolase family protein [uncultured Carboxylicivirga sp.]